MPELKFAVQADFEKVIRLKQEINHLETELQKLGRNAAPSKVKELENRLAASRGEFNRMVDAAAKAGNEVERSSDIMANSMKKVGAAIAGAFAFDKVQQFVGQMIAVRTEFQKADVAIQTMLGSKEKADALMGKVRDYAKVSPLEFADITNATKMMIGFNIEAEKVPRFLSAIGDVSMGEQQNFQSLTLAFSQMSATGKLMGQDLLQMINAGFNPLQTMAEKTGKSIATLKDEMSKGAISAEMVQQAFIDATSAGGKFYQMAEKSAQTIGGQISMLEDAMAAMYNELGTKSEGFIISSIQGITKLIENYERIGKAIGSLVAAYGVYKAAVIAVTTVEKIRATGIMALSAWEQRLVISTMAHKVATEGLTKAQLLLNKAMLTNPYVAMAAAITACGVALYNMQSATERANDIVGEYNAKQEEAERLERERADQMQKNISVAADESAATGTRKKALHDLISAYPSIFAKYKTEADMLRDILNIKERIAAFDGQRTATRTREETAKLQKEVKALQKEINARGKNKANEYNEAFAGISTSKLQDTLKANQKILAAAQEKQRKDAQKAAYSNLNAYGDKTIAAQIKAREDALNRFKISPNLKRVNIGSGALGGSLTQKEIEDQLKLLQLEQNARKERSKGMRELAKEAEVAYRKALAEQKAFLNSGGKGLSDQQKRDKVDELAAKAKTTKAEWDKLTNATNRKVGSGGNTEADNAADAERRAGELLASIIQSNTDNEIALRKDGHEKNLALIENDFNKRTAAIKKQGEELRKLNKKSGTGGKNGALTAEQTAALKEQTRLAQQERDARTAEENERYAEELADRHIAELQSMRDYIKEYGTFQQQKLAIAEEYAEKIQKAQNEGERLKLTKEKDAALADVEAKAVNAKIDWQLVFGNVGLLMKDALKETLEQLKAYTKTAQFRAASPTDQKTIYEAMEKLRSQIGTTTSNFKDMATAIAIYQNALKELDIVTAEEEANQKQLAAAIVTARKRVEELGKSSTSTAEEQKAAQDELDGLYNKQAQSANRVVTAQERVSVSANNMVNIVKDVTQPVSEIGEFLRNANIGQLGQLWAAFEKLQGGIEGLKGLNNVADASKRLSDKAKGAADNIAAVGSETAGKLAEFFGKGGKVAQIISAILSILDILKEGLGTLISGLLDAILGAVEGIIDNILSGKFFEQIGTSLYDGITGIIGNIIGHLGSFFTAGAISSDPTDWFTASESARAIEEMTDTLTDSNEQLRKSIDGLKDKIVEGKGGASSVRAAMDAQSKQAQIVENSMRILEGQMSYSSAHHSNAYYFSLAKESYKKMNATLAQYAKENDTELKEVWSLGDLYKLTPEEMNEIRTINNDVWHEIKTRGKYDKGEYWESYADEAGKAKEIVDSLVDTMTGTSFDSLFDNFVASLMDIEKSAEDFSKDFSEMLTKAVLNANISDMLSNDMKQWREDMSKYLESDGLSNAERDNLSRRWEDMVVRGQQIRDEVFAATGYPPTEGKYSTEAQGTINISKSMTDDTGNQLVGIITATHMTAQQILANSQLQSQNILTMNVPLSQLAAGCTEIRSIADETRDLMAQSFLELQQIRENTGAIVQPILRIDKRLTNIESKL